MEDRLGERMDEVLSHVRTSLSETPVIAATTAALVNGTPLFSPVFNIISFPATSLSRPVFPLWSILFCAPSMIHSASVFLFNFSWLTLDVHHFEVKELRQCSEEWCIKEKVAVWRGGSRVR